jgi:PAS domain S-box-containing protein
MDGQLDPVEYFKNPILTKAGEERILAWYNTLIKDSDGNIIGTLSCGEDITDREKAEKALMIEHAKAQTYLDIAAVIFIAIDTEGNVTLINQKGCKVLGYKESEIIGKNWFNTFVPERLRSELISLSKKLLTGKMDAIEYFENPVITKSGEERIIAWHNTILKDENGNKIGHLSSGEDITDRKEAELQIEKDLEEKVILLQEIHHRVKNNLQVIISLLNLQSQQITDKKMLKLFQESKNRIYSMALVHEKLYGSKDLSKIDFKDYVSSMLKGLFKVYEITGKISLDIKIKDVNLDIDTAISCGLILNELVSNALKHAFPDNREGKISITFKSLTDSSYDLIVQDNGIGLPAHLNFEQTETLGLRLVRILSQQIGGTVLVERSDGTTFRINFQTPLHSFPETIN